MWPLMCQHDNSPETVRKGQQLHQNMAWSPSIPLQHSSCWEKHPTASTVFNQSVLQIGEGEIPIQAERTTGPSHPKWQPTSLHWMQVECNPTVDQALERMKHQEIVGFAQPGRISVGWGAAIKRWSKVTKKERNNLIINSCELTVAR